MSERPGLAPADSLPEARLARARSAWLLWLIPLGAVALCGWFLYRDFVAAGPKLTVYFRNVDGLEAGNTQVKYRGAKVGMVKNLELTSDSQFVKVGLRLTRSARGLAGAGSVFWIVRPEVKLGGISGLRTIVSGEYITARPGPGPSTNTFFGIEKAPTDEGSNALQLVLFAPKLSSLQGQSPIIYRGVEIGEVLGYQLGPDSQEVVIRAAVRQEYAPLVRMNSKFWNAGGIDLKLGLFRGAEISAESAKTLIGGGIEMATPPAFEDPAKNGTAFRLYERPEEAWKAWAPAIALHLPEEAPQTKAASQTLLK